MLSSVKSPKVPSDIEIAQSARPRRIVEVASELGLAEDDLDLYGKFKAKLPLELAARPPRGKLVLVTAINPTPAGEGKSTVSVGLTQALRRLGTKALLCMREPSLGPVFGVKGGAAGGGFSQVLPMEDINLHFTGDFHAIASAHALLSAEIDNHLQQGNELGLDPRRITWPRSIDMNDRALRKAVIGLGGAADGVVREERWIILPASEIMAVVALASSRDDLQQRLARIVVGATAGKEKRFVRVADLGIAGALSVLLKDALRPNLVQTLEGGPALVHCGPFGNIAHGCNSVVATRSALALADVVVTEAGFGSDLGAEKFFDIKCRSAGLEPQAAVLVATIRALKMHGGADRKSLGTENLAALQEGLAHADRHVQNVRQFGVPVVMAINRFVSDTDAELKLLLEFAQERGVRVRLCEVWAKGGLGGEDLAREVLDVLAREPAQFQPLYPLELSLRKKLDVIVQRVYGGEGVDLEPAAERAIAELEAQGMGNLPVCVAKTQYSFSDDPSRLGSPRGFRLRIQAVTPSAGAGFVVARAGDIMTMPGLPKVSAAQSMRLGADGAIVGLS